MLSMAINDIEHIRNIREDYDGFYLISFRFSKDSYLEEIICKNRSEFLRAIAYLYKRPFIFLEVSLISDFDTYEKSD